VVPHVLTGGLGKRARKAILEQIENTAPDQPLALVATGQYLGEGFDCPQLDTLFLALPTGERTDARRGGQQLELTRSG